MTDIFLYTARGGRDDNEDFIGYASTDEGVVAALSDGVGGVCGGDIASRTVVDTIIVEPYEAEDDAQWLSERMRLADKRVKDEQKRLNNRMLSTVVALRVMDGKAVWAHAGDSRLYYIHDSAIAEVTADHTVAFKKYMAGQIRRGDIVADEDRNSLLNAVGSEGEPRFDIGSADVTEGDAFLLCSDGVWAKLQDQEVLFDYLKADSAERWAELVLLRVIDRTEGQGDNVSIITVMI